MASSERIFTDLGNPVVQGDVFESVATRKRLSPNFSDTFGEGHRGEASAAREGTLAN
eukprot:m.155810 g.155810  ORF g.155810 m.155810 type:complete len:57 (+) comp14421_c0_seq1:115-285(+)